MNSIILFLVDFLTIGLPEPIIIAERLQSPCLNRGICEDIIDGDEFLLAMRFLPAARATAIVEEDLKLIDFNPEKEFKEVRDHIARKMAELSQ